MPIRKSNDTLFYLIGIIPVIWLALLLAQSLGGGLPELLRNLTAALEQPTNIVWTDKSLPTILICLAAYTGAHKKVISEITIMASVRRGW